MIIFNKSTKIVCRGLSRDVRSSREPGPESVKSRDSHVIVLRVGREVEIWQLLHGEHVSLA